MTLINSERVRGSVINFKFKHTSKKLGTIIINQTAINEGNAKRKAWKEISKSYKLEGFGSHPEFSDPDCLNVD